MPTAIPAATSEARRRSASGETRQARNRAGSTPASDASSSAGRPAFWFAKRRSAMASPFPWASAQIQARARAHACGCIARFTTGLQDGSSGKLRWTSLTSVRPARSSLDCSCARAQNGHRKSLNSTTTIGPPRAGGGRAARALPVARVGGRDERHGGGERENGSRGRPRTAAEDAEVAADRRADAGARGAPRGGEERRRDHPRAGAEEAERADGDLGDERQHHRRRGRGGGDEEEEPRRPRRVRAAPPQ